MFLKRKASSSLRSPPRKSIPNLYLRVSCSSLCSSQRFPGLEKLFFSEEPNTTDKRLRLVHENPNIYVIDGFLKPPEILHIAEKCGVDLKVRARDFARKADPRF